MVVNGTTGESPTVAWEEVAALVQETRDARKGTAIPIVVTGTNATASTVARTEDAGRLGADAVLVVVPYYSRPSEEGIVAHYREVARVGVPIIVYEVPYRTGVRLSADTMRKIMDLDGIIGLKDSSGSLELVQELNRYESKPILCGEDILFHAMLSQGASGGILASANVAPINSPKSTGWPGRAS
ncbi:dihydrodipicolinate synthase family protein [Paenibacillaceae bacterium WGS1546]|uniref:dihydrodipicolinate synthase family protein n=1 Tax=Cohnella sp. WGS1546 TaxID=3366810 RepID=UPI00372D6DA8